MTKNVLRLKKLTGKSKTDNNGNYDIFLLALDKNISWSYSSDSFKTEKFLKNSA